MVTAAGTITLELLLANSQLRALPKLPYLGSPSTCWSCPGHAGRNATDRRYVGRGENSQGNVVTAPFIDAVNMTVKSDAEVPAVAEKATLLDPAVTRTLPGTPTPPGCHSLP
jgi:hypothetical protein